MSSDIPIFRVNCYCDRFVYSCKTCQVAYIKSQSDQLRFVYNLGDMFLKLPLRFSISDLASFATTNEKCQINIIVPVIFLRTYLGTVVYIQHKWSRYVTSRNHYSSSEKTDNNVTLVTSLIQNTRNKALHCRPELCNGSAGGYQRLVPREYPSKLPSYHNSRSRHRKNCLQHCNGKTYSYVEKKYFCKKQTKIRHFDPSPQPFLSSATKQYKKWKILTIHA